MLSAGAPTGAGSCRETGSKKASSYLSSWPGDARGPWNAGALWDYISNRDEQAAVDGGDGQPESGLTDRDRALDIDLTVRTASDIDIDPATGAELTVGAGAWRVKMIVERIDE